jgi:hypothetical protein
MNPILLKKKINDFEQFVSLYLQPKIQGKPGSPVSGGEFCLKEEYEGSDSKLYEAKPEAHDLCGFDVYPGDRMVIYNILVHTYTEYSATLQTLRYTLQKQ